MIEPFRSQMTEPRSSQCTLLCFMATDNNLIQLHAQVINNVFHVDCYTRAPLIHTLL